MSLVEHARRELELLGEERDTIDWYCRVIEEFASYGHSGGSASVAIPILQALLRFEALTPLTDAPGEWMDITEALWQSRRNAEAFSEDGGTTYYLLSERQVAEDLSVTPLHRSEPAR